METLLFEDFLKVDIRVGQIIQAEAVPKSEKLLKLSVSLGSELGIRTIMAGIAKNYPDLRSLENQKILVVANLAPRKMMGIESHGMIMAATKVDGTVALVTCPDAELGSRLG